MHHVRARGRHFKGGRRLGGRGVNLTPMRRRLGGLCFERMSLGGRALGPCARQAYSEGLNRQAHLYKECHERSGQQEHRADE